MPKKASSPSSASIAVSAAAALAARFRRQRPLRGGSLIVTLFGDSIMPRGGAIALGSLIELAAPFGLNERLGRTATARLAHDGWLEVHPPHRLVGLGWDLEGLGERYRRFVNRFGMVQAELKRHRNTLPQDGFLVRTLLIHEYRRLHLRDPLLPAQLLKANWAGAQAAVLCRDIYARVFVSSELHLSRVAARLTGSLPAADASVMQRFGAIAPLLQGADHHTYKVV